MLIMDNGRQRLAHCIAYNTTVGLPAYAAVGYNYRDGGNVTTLVELRDEIERVPISFRKEEQYRTRYVATFDAHKGCGLWREIGLFDADAKVDVLNNCDSAAGWTTGTGNTLTLNTTTVMDGSGAMRCQGQNGLSFQNLNLGSITQTHTESSKLQLWYYINDVSKLQDELAIYATASTTDPSVNRYIFTVNKSLLSNGWNYISRRFSDGSKSGTVTPNTIRGIRLSATKTASVIEYLDRVRIFTSNGIMWAREEVNPAIDKQYGEVRVIYSYLSFQP